MTYIFLHYCIHSSLFRTNAPRFTQRGVRGQEGLHQVRIRKLKLGEVPTTIAGLPLWVDLVQVVVERGLGVEDLLAGLTLKPWLLGWDSVVSRDVTYGSLNKSQTEPL